MPDARGTRWRRRRWIIDGHNAIFTLPVLGRLQRDQRRQEARELLERQLGPFAAQLVKPLYVVYDGNTCAANPDTRAQGQLQTFYSQPPEEADDRIVYLAGQAVQAGESVAIVTDDRRTLGGRLPPGVQVWPVRDFWKRFLGSDDSVETIRPEAEAGEDEHLTAEDRSEIEAMFLERGPQIEALARQGARRRERQALTSWEQRTAPERIREEPPGGRQRTNAVTEEMDVGWDPKRVFESPNQGGTPTPTGGSRKQESTADLRRQKALEKQREVLREARKARGARKQARRLENRGADQGKRPRAKKRRQ